MANRPPPPPREFDWARMLRTLSFWALVIVGSIALVQFASTRRQEAAEISYSEFVEEFESGNVAAVEITERQRIRGTFRRAASLRWSCVVHANAHSLFGFNGAPSKSNGPRRCDRAPRVVRATWSSSPSDERRLDRPRRRCRRRPVGMLALLLLVSNRANAPR